MCNDWNKDTLKALLDTNDKAVCRALLLLHARQTADEQAVQHTKYVNNRGFSGSDAPILSSLAVWYKSKGWLSPKQMTIARRKVKKYTRQLLEEVAAKQERDAQKMERVMA